MFHPIQLKITEMTLEDTSLLMHYGTLFLQEMGATAINLNAYVYYLKKRLMSGRSVVLIARTLDGQPVGAIAGTREHDTFTDKYYVQQEFWYIVDHYRGTDAARQLDNALATWGRERGATEIVAGYFTGTPYQIGPLLNRMGYKPVSVCYRRQIHE